MISILTQNCTAAQADMMANATVRRENFSEVSGTDGAFTLYPRVIMDFPAPHYVSEVGNIGLLFGTPSGAISKDIYITFYLNGTETHQQHNINTYNLYNYGPVVTPISSSVRFDRVIIEFQSINRANTRFRLDAAFIGKFVTFTDADVVACNATSQTDLSALTLPSGTLGLTLSPDTAGAYAFRRGMVMQMTVDSHTCGTWYISEDAEQTGANAWAITAEDAIGYLSRYTMTGKWYYNRSAREILADILENRLYYDAADLPNLTLSGILQTQNCRTALQQLLIACGCMAATDGDAPLKIARPAAFDSFIPTAKTEIFAQGGYPVVVIGGIRYTREYATTLGYQPETVRIISTNASGDETRSVAFQVSQRYGNTGYIQITDTGFSLLSEVGEPSEWFGDEDSTSYIAVQRVPAAAPTAKTIGEGNTYLSPRIRRNVPASLVTVTAHRYVRDANGAITAQGYQFTDKPRDYTREVAGSGMYPNEISVRSATLVGEGNADAVIARVIAASEIAESWTGKIVWNGESIADALTVPTRWNTHTGTITKKSLTVSKLTAAQLEVT